MAQDIVATEDLTPHLITRFVLSPTLWAMFPLAAPKLNWKQKKYAKNNIPRIPDKRGIYAFLIRNSRKDCQWPEHGYIMYIGITGVPGSQRTLRDRFAEYFHSSQLLRRHRISRLVRTWGKDLYFHYAPVSDPSMLRRIETQLLGAIVPPCNQGDLPAQIRPAVDAFI